MTWGNAIAEYGSAGRPTGFFPVNVPFLLPVLPFADGSYFKVLNETVVLFRWVACWNLGGVRCARGVWVVLVSVVCLHMRARASSQTHNAHTPSK
jgi:hypothetical protein